MMLTGKTPHRCRRHASCESVSIYAYSSFTSAACRARAIATASTVAMDEVRKDAAATTHSLLVTTAAKVELGVFVSGY